MDVGKLLIVGFQGTELTAQIKESLLEIKPAGIIFYDTNIESRDQVKKLIRDLKVLLGEKLIITTDQEGGKVERLRKINTSLPSLWALGKLDNESMIESHASVLATEMLDLGFNMVLGPCVDLCTNPKNPIIGSRSLGADAIKVSEQVGTMLKAFQKTGIKTCAKHFPGHGDTQLDSHTDLPVVHFADLERVDTKIEMLDAKTLYKDHVKPFKSSINSGVDSIMVSHVAFPQLEVQEVKAKRTEELVPASLSRTVIGKELKERLGFDGLLISDEMTMKAVSDLGHYGEISRRAIEAGCDLLIWNTDLEQPREAKEYIEALVNELSEDSEISNRVKESIERVNSFLLNLDEAKPLEIDFDKNEKAMLEIAKSSIDWHSDEVSLGEINKENTAILAFDHPKLEKEYIKKASGLDVLSLAEKNLDKYKNLIILSFQEALYPEQSKRIKELRESQKFQIIQCSCDLSDEGSDLSLYGANQIHIKALMGIINSNGRKS